MTPEEIPAELKSMLDEDAGKEHSITGAVVTSLARILARHREMVLEEADDALGILRAQHVAEREIHEAAVQLLCAYRDAFDEYGFRDWLEDNDGDEALERIDGLERALNKLTCQCCVFGNHTELCTCDGEGCCHPDQYAEYLPVRRHGNWGEA